MGYPSKIGKLYLKRQAGGFGVAETSFSDVTDLIATEVMVPSAKIESLASEYLRGNFHAQPVVPGSREGAELAFKTTLAGFLATLPSGAPTEHVYAMVLKALLGGQSIAGYSTTGLTSGSTVNAINYTDGQLNAALSGHGILVPLAAGGYGWAWAKTINTAGTPDVLTPACPLKGAPAASGTIFGGITCFLNTDNPEPFTAQWRGGAANAAKRLRDCVPVSGKLTIVTGQQPKLDVGLRAIWAHPEGGAAPAQFVVPWPDLPATYGASGARYYSVDAGAAEAVPKVEIDMSMSVKPRGDINAEDGFNGYDVTDREVTVTVWTTSEHMGNELEQPGTEIDAVQIDVCTTPGRAASTLLRNAQIAEAVSWEVEEDVVMVKRVYKCRPTAGDTAGGNPANSPMRIVFG